MKAEPYPNSPKLKNKKIKKLEDRTCEKKKKKLYQLTYMAHK